jgi:transcriptional regulator with XRE-family HTH domain
VAKGRDALSDFGRLIRKRRTAAGRTQTNVAAALGITQASYSAYETGDALPSVPVLLTLLRELGITLEELWVLLDPDGEPNGAAVA